MQDPDVLARMRVDWNQRAGEDANYYVAFGRRAQEDAEFFRSGENVARGLEADFVRLRARDRALEIGCGPGRLVRPLARHFGEVHGVDISEEMIRLGRERLRGTGNAFLHHNPGSDLSMFPEAAFDFVYSYAVFQHIPSREVVFGYLAEARRVLKEGGILRCQVNGLPPHARTYDTWSGVRITTEEVANFALERDLALLALEGAGTQYLWITCRKMQPGWARSLHGLTVEPAAAIRAISNTHSGERAVPVTGPFAAMSIWIGDLPSDCDLNHLEVAADGAACRLTYLGEPDSAGTAQLDALLPEGVRTGLVPVSVNWLGRPVSPAGWALLFPAGPSVPRLWSVTDGIDLLSNGRITTGAVKLTFVEVERPGQAHVTVDGFPVREYNYFCADSMARRIEFNFRLPEGMQPGTHAIHMVIGSRELPAVPIEVV
jgi:SAM-dependent methyltransferase